MGEAGHVELGEEETLLLRHLSCGQHPHKLHNFDGDFDDDHHHNVDDEYFELEEKKVHICLVFSSCSLSQVAITCVVWSLYVLIDR